MMETLKVLFEDNHLIIVDKPAGMLTQPSGTEEDSIEAHVKQYIKEKYNKPGAVFLEAVHRLDKPASGIVAFARTSKALSRMQQAMREQKFKKKYLAVVEGEIPEPKGPVQHTLLHADYRAEVALPNDPNGKLCTLYYNILKRFDGNTLVEIDLITGRYHQIRCQLAALGYPIVGDVKYGAKKALPQGNILLCHHSLSFTHPVTREEMVITTPFPSML